MAQQPSREFASTDPTTRIQDAGFQVPGVSPKISLNSRSHLQHFQRPTSSHFCKDAPSLSRVGYEHVARGSRGRLKIFGTQNSRSSFNDVTTPKKLRLGKRKRMDTAACAIGGIPRRD